MLFEVTTTLLAGGIAGFSYLQKQGGSSDHQKIINIARNCGLVNKEGKEIRIFRKSKFKNYTEYVFQMPQGLSEKQFIQKLDNFQDGLNIKGTVPDFSFVDFKKINWKSDVIDQIKEVLTKRKKLQKEVEISFDGMIKFRVYNQKLTDSYLYEEEKFSRIKGWKIPVGVDRSEQLIMHDFELIPHLALGGATRYGKSNFLNAMIVTLLKTHPNDVSFTLIDLKGGVEFSDYEHLKQVKGYAEEPEEALNSLKNAYDEMINMQKKLKKMGKKKVQDAGIKERHFIIIDEVGELNPEEAVDKKDIRKDGELIHKSEKTIKEECQTYMSKISRIGAGYGFRLILATQYGTGDVIPRQCKQNSDAKLSFKVRNATASRVILDEEGAETLPRIKGRAIYLTDQKHIVQTPFIDGDVIERTIKINLNPRKDDVHASDNLKGTETRKHTIEFEEIGLS